MLSNIGRAAIRRTGLGGSHSSAGRVGQWTWQIQRVCINQHSSYVTQSNRTHDHQHIYSLTRSYATTSKAAAKPRAKTTTTKKVTKKPVKKAAKKVAKPKKKVVAKKAKPVKKVLTEEQLAKRAAVKEKTHIKDLKAAALLSPPKSLPNSAWKVLLSESVKDADVKLSGIGSLAASAAAKYKGLSPSEREHYNHIANQNKAANEVAYKQWVESHTPDQIRAANVARSQLKRKKVAKILEPIKDIRQPKRGALSGRSAFIEAKHKSGDMKGLSFTEASSTIAKEWRELSEAEKKPFEDTAASDRRRYEQEYKTVFHRDVPLKKVSATA